MPTKARSRAASAGALSLLLSSAFALGGQAQVVPPQQHESVVTNIGVPVRVLKKDAFVDGLTLADFEVYENGVRQPLEAIYLIKGQDVLREERAPGTAAPRPQGVRHFVLSVDLKEYLPKVGEALDYFFTDVLGPKDSLFVVTPVKTYKFRTEYLARVPRPEIAEKLKGILKKDIQLGAAPYRRLMQDFYRLEAEDFPPEQADLKEIMLFNMAMEIRDLTQLKEGQVLRFADTLKSLEGDKHVFLIFQKEVLPEHEFSDERQAELVKTVDFDVDKIKRYFSDASITVHCLFITKIPSVALDPMGQNRTVRAYRLQDLTANLYASFKEMAVATGGLVESTTNPDFALRRAADVSSNYYLLYYRPLDYRADGRFQKIEVRVKGEGLKITHRLGYVAD